MSGARKRKSVTLSPTQVVISLGARIGPNQNTKLIKVLTIYVVHAVFAPSNRRLQIEIEKCHGNWRHPYSCSLEERNEDPLKIRKKTQINELLMLF